MIHSASDHVIGELLLPHGAAVLTPRPEKCTKIAQNATAKQGQQNANTNTMNTLRMLLSLVVLVSALLFSAHSLRMRAKKDDVAPGPRVAETVPGPSAAAAGAAAPAPHFHESDEHETLESRRANAPAPDVVNAPAPGDATHDVNEGANPAPVSHPVSRSETPLLPQRPSLSQNNCFVLVRLRVYVCCCVVCCSSCAHGFGAAFLLRLWIQGSHSCPCTKAAPTRGVQDLEAALFRQHFFIIICSINKFFCLTSMYVCMSCMYPVCER